MFQFFQKPPKRARTTPSTPSASTSFNRTRYISAVALDVFGSRFSLRPVLFELEVIMSDLCEVIMSDLSPVLTAIFSTRGWKPLLVGLVYPLSLFVQKFYANIHDVSGSSFRVFLWGRVVKITLDFISNLIHIPRVICPTFPYLTLDSLPTDSLVHSTVFNTPLEGGPGAIRTGFLQTECQILLRIVCTNL